MKKNRVSGVSWVKPAEPSFLRRFKNDVGYKDGPTIDTKRDVMPALADDGGSDQEDELPQVVVLKGGDLTADEVKKIKTEMHIGDGAEKDDGPPGGKIVFKKPDKRSSSDKFQGLTASSSKKKKSDEGEKKEMKSGKKVKNNSLLSFGGDEEKEED